MILNPAGMIFLLSFVEFKSLTATPPSLKWNLRDGSPGLCTGSQFGRLAEGRKLSWRVTNRWHWPAVILLLFSSE